MNAAPGRWRRMARKVSGHASWVLPGARSLWADAMRRELDYIEDDRAALRWAIGCVMASYAARLAALPRLRWRVSSRPVVASILLLFLRWRYRDMPAVTHRFLPSRRRPATCPT